MDQENHPIIDINTADEATLTELQGVGRRLAKRIIEKRPFASIDDLSRVRGISEKDVARLRPALSIADTPEPSQPLGEIETVAESEEPDQEIVTDEQPLEDGTPTEVHQAVIQDEITPDEVQGVEGSEQTVVVEEPEETIDDSGTDDQAVEIIEEFDAQPLPEELEPIEEIPVQEPASQPGYITRGGACSLILIGGFFTLILAVALTLGILSSINQGQLNYASPAQIAALHAQAELLSAQTQTLADDIEGLRTRMDNLEALSSQVSEIETEVSGLQEDLVEIQATIASNQAEFDALVAQLEIIDAEIQALTDQGARSESFLEGLRSLMEELFPQEPEIEATP